LFLLKNNSFFLFRERILSCKLLGRKGHCYHFSSSAKFPQQLGPRVNIIEVEKVTYCYYFSSSAIKLFQAIVDQCAKNTTENYWIIVLSVLLLSQFIKAVWDVENMGIMKWHEKIRKNTQKIIKKYIVSIEIRPIIKYYT
jgi:hypothetical protein